MKALCLNTRSEGLLLSRDLRIPRRDILLKYKKLNSNKTTDFITWCTSVFSLEEDEDILISYM